MTETTDRAAILDQIARYLVGVSCPHPLRVGIDGRTAAGKTTLGDELVAPIERLGRPVRRIGIDDFHLPRVERRERFLELLSWQRYYLAAFDQPAIRAAIAPLGPGGDRHYRRALFDSLHDRPIDEPLQLAPPDAIVLIDGVFLRRPELADLWDILIFVRVDADDSLERGPARDAAWIGSREVAEPAYRARYIPGEDHYLATHRPQDHADLIVDNRDPARPRLRFR